jgi:hypothetical protein
MNQFSAVIEGMVIEYLPSPRGVEAPMSDLSRRTTFAQGITSGYIKGSGEILRRIDSLPCAGRLDSRNRGEIRKGPHYFQSPNFFNL